jgi:hypothetical protein
MTQLPRSLSYHRPLPAMVMQYSLAEPDDTAAKKRAPEAAAKAVVPTSTQTKFSLL